MRFERIKRCQNRHVSFGGFSLVVITMMMKVDRGLEASVNFSQLIALLPDMCVHCSTMKKVIIIITTIMIIIKNIINLIIVIINLIIIIICERWYTMMTMN